MFEFIYINSGKRRKTRRSKRNASGTIPPLKYKERKKKLKEYITNIHNRDLDELEIIPLLRNTELNDKDYSILILGITEFLNDWADDLDLEITDDYIKEKLTQAKNNHEANSSSSSRAGKISKKSKKKYKR